MKQTTMEQSHSGRALRRRPARVLVALTASLAVGLTMAWVPGASADPTPPASPKSKASAVDTHSDVRELDSKQKFSTKKLSMKSASKSASKSSKDAKKSAQAEAPGTTPAVGTTRPMLALDDYNGKYYNKDYTLQAVGDKVEVWVADDTAFPAGDCRKAVADTTTVTRVQAASLAKQFDEDMFPKESAAFSVAPDRNGSKTKIAGADYSGDGDKIMTLVDNVRDDNYYEGVNNAPTYIAGFFSSQINELTDRNVMTIDAFDWMHRTGANPVDAATGNPCTSRPARPFLYEGVFAHEYQHLLQYYQDPFEVNWINEGLSDFAISLTGYGDATRTVFQPRAESHIYCYQGYGTVQTKYNPNARNCGGPENSLTLWGDQGDGDILADYGEAWSMMLFLRDRYGLGFMSSLHRDGRNQGLVSVQRTLDGYAAGTDVFSVLHDFQVSTLVDGLIDNRKGKVYGKVSKSRVTSKSLNSSVNLGNPKAYANAGAPSNGADYVALRARSGLYLKGKDLKSLRFDGAKTLVPQPLAWSVVADPPKHAGNAALWSGNDNNTDATAIAPVTVPTADPIMTFNSYLLAEEGYDYGYLVVSTDGGETYTPVANKNTVEAPLGQGLNGDSADWATESFDLSAYAGKSILVGFRYVSDGGTNDGGWYVDDVTLGGKKVSDGSTTAPFKSSTETRPSAVKGWKVSVVGIDRGKSKNKVRIAQFTTRNHSVTKSTLRKMRTYQRVVVIVANDEPTEQLQTPALYKLTVNGVDQPGGGKVAGVKAKVDRF